MVVVVSQLCKQKITDLYTKWILWCMNYAIIVIINVPSHIPSPIFSLSKVSQINSQWPAYDAVSLL